MAAGNDWVDQNAWHKLPKGLARLTCSDLGEHILKGCREMIGIDQNAWHAMFQRLPGSLALTWENTSRMAAGNDRTIDQNTCQVLFLRSDRLVHKDLGGDMWNGQALTGND